jgi:hypothetical protein
MYRNLQSILGMALCLLVLGFPRVFAADQSSRPLPTAQLVAVEGASHTYHLMDYDKRVVRAAVPAQSLADVRTSNPDGTVRVTVASLDSTTGQMKGTTDAGQVLVLALPREELGRMRIGDTFTLVVPQHARVTESR